MSTSTRSSTGCGDLLAHGAFGRRRVGQRLEGRPQGGHRRIHRLVSELGPLCLEPGDGFEQVVALAQGLLPLDGIDLWKVSRRSVERVVSTTGSRCGGTTGDQRITPGSGTSRCSAGRGIAG